MQSSEIGNTKQKHTMTDTDSFCFPGQQQQQRRAPLITQKPSASFTGSANYMLRKEPGYFPPGAYFPNKTQIYPPPPVPPPSSNVWWNMIHSRGTANFLDLPVAQMASFSRSDEKSSPATMREEPTHWKSINEYMDSQERGDLDLDEHLAVPVYFSADELMKSTSRKQQQQQQTREDQKQQSQQAAANQKSSPKKDSANGFLPFAFNSLRSLVGNVARLSSFIMGGGAGLGQWNATSNPSTPENGCNRSSQSSPRDEHLFFDVDDIDFLPETPTTSRRRHDHHAESPCEFEAFFLSDDDDDIVHDKLQQRQRPSYETKQAEGKQKLVGEGPVPVTKDQTASVGGGQSILDNQNACGIAKQEVVVVPEVPNERRNQNSAVTVIELRPNAIKLSSPVDIVKGIESASCTTAAGHVNVPCVRRFISTPEQECNRMSVMRPRKRQTIKAALVTRSTPIAVGRSSNASSCYRPQPRTLYHQTKRTLDKNRKEKRRHEIASNIHEDYCSSDSEAAAAAEAGVGSLFLSDTEDDDLLPLTARNLMEPSCLLEFCGESSMNSSTGSLGGRSAVSGISGSVPRRNSINFQSKANYEKEFPAMHGQRERSVTTSEREEQVVVVDDGGEEKQQLQMALMMVTKKNGAVYFEIPNSPQRRRVLVPSKMKPLKQRTSSVMSSSVGSSPATSFDAGGKFWGHHGRGAATNSRRVRTVSEGSEDDLIEFVSDGCTDYLADVFSETEDDDDEDYSSEEEEEEESEDESGGLRLETSETETEDEEEEEVQKQHDGRRLISLRDMVTRGMMGSSCRRGESDLPDSGVEEKKVRRIKVWHLNVICFC